MERGIIARAKALFDVKGVNQREFADALGRSPSWVSAFFSGKRPANDIHLLMKIARYFGVTVGYLLNETDKGHDAKAMTLLAAWSKITNERARNTVLQSALMLQDQTDDPDTGPGPGPSGGHEPGGGTTKGPRKHR